MGCSPWRSQEWDLVTVSNLLAIRETRVPTLGWEDPLEKGMATHSSLLAWEIRKAWQADVHGAAKSST